ncbi:MAG: long-chain fatty acid--CoA ligase [Actinomycetota bacterium]|nr:long-chain fatty acid--CoA ligase [Actinomycetota bacterium]
MESATASPTSTGVGSKTIADLLPKSVAKYGPGRAVMFKDDSGRWATRSYDEVGEIVKDLSLGMIALGIEKGDKVAILGNTRPEWTYFDFAALTAGATVVPIYQTNSPEECEYVLENSDARAVIVEDEEQLEKIRAIRNRCPQLEHVIRMTGKGGGAISFDELVERGSGLSEADWAERYESVTPGDICTFIYTSGTTGPPKGCVISHGNYRAMLDMVVSKNVMRGDDELTYLFLPLAHSFALLIQLGSFELGASIAYWERDPLRIIPNLAEVKPTYFPSVPRIFEKIYTAATAAIEKEGGAKKKIFDWAIGVGKRYREAERSGGAGALLGSQYKLADRLVLEKIRNLFGGNLRVAVTGAAPINPDILRFFDAAGVLVLEGWGMTETSTAATIATPEDFKFGTIGKPFPGVEVKIASDGEILVKGPNIFQGYYKNPDATAETIVDGWLHTGDLGEVDSDGYLKITGRKKDIIITAGGKNITPANLEAEIKQHPLVSQCVVVGDRRPYLVCVVTLDPEEAQKLATEKGWDASTLHENDEVRASIQAHLDQINQKFARVEQVKKFQILPKDFTQEGGELTPSMKVKRNVVAEKYSSDVESLYSG